jgi:hypothetical protein
MLCYIKKGVSDICKNKKVKNERIWIETNIIPARSNYRHSQNDESIYDIREPSSDR